MNYVASLVDAGNNVAAVNCSWGSSNSGGLDAAVDNLLAHDVMIVHAAGNSNADSPGFLGDKAGVMNVAATGRNGVGASFSNFGSWVDVAAPGVDIMSTYANPDDPDLTHNYVALFAGTSMSAPHICGIAALLESCDPTLTGPQKFALIVNNTTAYNDSRDLGSGIANAKLALNAAGCGSCADVTPVAAFSGSPTSGVVPLTVNFTDATTNNPDTWLWDFGDGNNSSLQNPSNEYTATGTYSVTLTSSNCSGSDVSTQVNYITVTEPPCPETTPVAAFSGTPTSGDVPLTVNFTDATTNNPDTWLWSFGDGNNSSVQNPSHEYASAGTYTVSLTASNCGGSDVATQVDYITVTQPPQNMMHVHDIVVTVKQSGRNSSGIGVITIYDQNEQPVANANVTVVATGPTGGTGTAATNENGVVAFETKKTKNHTSEWCFEVTDVTHTTNTYDQASNHVTKACESGDVFGNGSGLSINHLSGAGVGEIHVALPDGFSVSNYPNPFNPSTKIGMNLPVASSWNISIFNIQGRLVEEFNGSSPAGPVVVEWNATSVASGIYFYKITAGEYSVTKKMMFLK
ncbi:MAG: PKD domain-containing protein [candidate division Zixibacteria bacterium]|nr:PKD domain-containing protein [candidate division Zixibacteria bacterium]